MLQLPHGYPFRLVEAVVQERNADSSEGVVAVTVAANGWICRGEGWPSPSLLAEAIAQAALLLEGGDPEIGRRGFLAGIENFEAGRAPRSGETLLVRVALAAHFGPIAKFRGQVLAGGERIAQGEVLVRKGESPASTVPTS